MNYRLFRSRRFRKWVIWGAVLMALLGLRWGWILYDRSRPVAPRQERPGKRLQRDYLIRLPKFYIWDLEAARDLVGKSLWVKKGFQLSYGPYRPGRGPSSESGSRRLLPLEELLVKDVVEQAAPEPSGDRDVLVLFDRGGVEMGTVIGHFDGAREIYRMYLDEHFYAKNPREIYRHWSERDWNLVEDHQLEPGMTFVQVELSIGNGTLIARDAGGVQLYEFPRRPGGEAGRCRVRFQGRQVTEVTLLD